MKHSFPMPATRASVAGLVAAVVLVGTVWATTSASNDVVDSTDTTLPTDSSLPSAQPRDSTIPASEPTVDDLLARVDQLSARVTVLEEAIGAMETALERASSSVTELTGRVNDTERTVATFADKTSQLSSDGTYTGVIAPSQISPRLTSDDIRGDWPLERTAGSLGLGRLVADGWGCSPDSRSIVALVMGAFRGVECAKISK